MRFVSAFYQETHPFDTFPFFDDFVWTNDPEALAPGDCLCVWGGADIHPSLYNKQKSIQSQAYEMPSRRDIIEWNLMVRAQELEIPIIGVCRGAQMLCALAGGYLIQHVTGHGGDHQIITSDGKDFVVNSLHHQMMVPGPAKHEVLAEINPKHLRSHVYWDENKQVDHNQEPEFIYFTDVKGFAVQWHPEMMAANAPSTKYIKQMMEKHLAI